MGRLGQQCRRGTRRRFRAEHPRAAPALSHGPRRAARDRSHRGGLQIHPQRQTGGDIVRPVSQVVLPAEYAPLLDEIKARVRTARVKAGLAANRELLALYWDIGRLIYEAQETK